ncbi:Thymocyte nuclear protein 1 [Penicillium subrubescens]|uniref:Thymocyte nuclear protein 1 n=1 Tax=Penicillium subrubescens TaxID=1316194 RepID=UPI0025457A67|nr:Thymocyte nuclear protein 1 [Penicillium subrubescens]KAJ5891618.1 Thymocyte nuclear protein 1 [Penicillium subrubescens]
MPPKRKSEGATMADESANTPSKRARNAATNAVASGKGTSSTAGSPQIGEKRKRGRPRKSIEESIPEPSDEPKRGRGRPRKVLSEADLAAAAAATASPAAKRGRGRPRKEPGTATATPSTTPKNGRGRPRKEPGTAAATSTTAPEKKSRGRPRKVPASAPTSPAVTKKAGRGRPRKSLPTNGATSVVEPKTKANEETEGSLPDEKPKPNTESTTEFTTDRAPLKDTGRSYWLMKAEPESRLEKGVDVKFSIDDLAAAKAPEPWDGVRNPVARNIMKEMKQGDYAFFYHSNCKVPGVVGVMEIVKEHSVDESAFDPKHPYYDPKSSRDAPKWVVVHVEFRRKFDKQVTLSDLKEHAQPGKGLENLQTLKQSRLSVSSVTPAQWKYILQLAGEDPQAKA